MRPMQLSIVYRCKIVIVRTRERRHFRAFATIVDAGGFARAAERLHVSQPALSRQIRALEIELGISLFDRVGRGVRLTSQGEDLLRHSRRLLAEFSSLVSGHAS